MGFTSCDSDPSDSSTNAGGTKVEKLAGAWVVDVFTCDEQGDVANIDNWNWEDQGAFGSDLMTYNTAANKGNEMWVDDQGESSVSVEDYAVAMIDEVEYPAHHYERFTIGY